ncbi:A24 family peptidase [Pseudomonas sp. LRF_L74]|uniref:A24 family peptidase n=1 Tax=Pseudomonas sp. LRF_L74 TaxID=3369422 RepID=UPI003F60BFA5
MDSTFSALVMIPAMLWVMASDLLYRRIHNLLVLVLLALWLTLPLSALLGFGPWSGLDARGVLGQSLSGLAGGALVLLVGYGLFCLGRVGAGDVKLVAVACLWVGPDKQMSFLIVTSLAGGLLALGLPMLNQIERVIAQCVQRLGVTWPRLGIPTPTVLTEQRPQGIPYGLAIAIGAFYTLLLPTH